MALVGIASESGRKFAAAFHDGKCYRLSDVLKESDSNIMENFYDIITENSELIEDRISEGIPDSIDDFSYCLPVPGINSIRDFYAFEDHVKAGRRMRNLDMIPEWYEIPVFYYSGTSSLFPSGSSIPYPRYSEALDFELELGFIIGKEGIDINRNDAMDYVFGVTLVNDWSARDEQLREMKMNLGPAKAKDFATSIGPAIMTSDSLMAKRESSGKFNVHVEGFVNSRKYSDSNLNRIYHNIDLMIERASMGTRLFPGDLIMTGTVGTGCILELGPEEYGWLKRGDRVELKAEGIGKLENEVI